MPRTLAELVQLVAGTLYGDGALIVNRALPLGLAQPGDITLIDASEKSKKLAADCNATAAVIASGTSERDGLVAGIALLEVADIHEAFATIVRSFQPQRVRRPGGISPRANISPTARIAQNVDIHPSATIDDHVEIDSGSVIYPGVYVGPGCRIGRDVQVFPNAVLYENTCVGDRAVIHAGVILGAYGFGYKQVEGHHLITHQLGNVEIGADVDIGAGSTIDRGTYGPTIIGEGTKIDDQVMIGHNCQIGRHNLICSQVGVAGSTSTGDYVVIAGQVGIRDHLHVGDRSTLAAKAGIMYDVEPGATMCGAPAYPMREWKLQQAALQKLPNLRHEIKAMERTLTELRAMLDAQTSNPTTSDSRHAA